MSSCCLASETPLNSATACAGFSEVLTWALCSRHENFEALRRNDDGRTAVCCGNPATAEFEVCRSTLLPGGCQIQIVSPVWDRCHAHHIALEPQLCIACRSSARWRHRGC